VLADVEHFPTVGGIGANMKNPVNFFYENLKVRDTRINELVRKGFEKVLK
jgi:hypothetical protein